MASMGSYFKLYRKALADDIFKGEPFDRFHAWVWMISEARYKPEVVQPRGEPITLLRGQLFARECDLVEIFGWSRGRVRRTLKLFEDEGMITVERLRSGTVITIANYEQYQRRTLDGTHRGTRRGTSYYYMKEIYNKSLKNAHEREGGAAAEWARWEDKSDD